MNVNLTRPIRTALILIAICISFEAVIFVPLLSLSLAAHTTGWKVVALAIILGAGALALLVRFRAIVQRVLGATMDRLARMPLSYWLTITIALATGLRLIWALSFPVAPKSDSAAYLFLAKALAHDRQFFIAHTWAYWPPGYPLYLSVWLRLGFTAPAAVICSNLLEQALATALAYALMKRFATEGASRLAASMLALWPSLITAADIAQKEQLLIPLLLAIVYLFIPANGTTPARSILGWVAAGVLFGFASLVQPSLQLFPLALALMGILYGLRLRNVAIATIVTGLVGLAIIAPWTIRNYQRFHSFVLISTNGGDNLYRANNPLATGGYTPHGARSYGNVGEIEKSKLGYRYAVEWIRAHPGAFASLALWKEALFLGDDSDGIYETFRRGRDIGGIEYLAPKAIMDGLWWLLWLLICQRMFAASLARDGRTRAVAMMFVPLVYLWGIHSVFESSGKYHLPIFEFIPMLFAILYESREFARTAASQLTGGHEHPDELTPKKAH